MKIPLVWFCSWDLSERPHINVYLIYLYNSMILPLSDPCGTCSHTSVLTILSANKALWSLLKWSSIRSTLYPSQNFFSAELQPHLTWTLAYLESLLYPGQFLFIVLGHDTFHEVSGVGHIVCPMELIHESSFSIPRLTTFFICIHCASSTWGCVHHKILTWTSMPLLVARHPSSCIASSDLCSWYSEDCP